MRLRCALAVALLTLLGADVQASERRRMVLKECWYVKQLETNRPVTGELSEGLGNAANGWMRATMPAQVHDMLLAKGVIPDPHVGRNAVVSAWVGEKDWVYACRFPTPDGIAGPVFLRFEGLDALADAYLNGVAIGHFENMFREYAVEVRDLLASPGEQNILVIVFSSPLQFMRAAKLPPDDPNSAEHKSLRKSHCDFGAYIGARPHSVKVGIYRDVVLDLPGRVWIEDVSIDVPEAKRNIFERIMPDAGKRLAPSA